MSTLPRPSPFATPAGLARRFVERPAPPRATAAGGAQDPVWGPHLPAFSSDAGRRAGLTPRRARQKAQTILHLEARRAWRRSQARAEDYRLLARHALERGLASPLEHVREKHRRSAAAWLALAASQERLTAGLRRSRQQIHDPAAPTGPVFGVASNPLDPQTS